MSRGISDSESVSMTYLSHAGRVLVWWLSIVLEKSNISAQVYATVREAGVLKTAPQQSSCVSHFLWGASNQRSPFRDNTRPFHTAANAAVRSAGRRGREVPKVQSCTTKDSEITLPNTGVAEYGCIIIYADQNGVLHRGKYG